MRIVGTLPRAFHADLGRKMSVASFAPSGNLTQYSFKRIAPPLGHPYPRPTDMSLPNVPPMRFRSFCTFSIGSFTGDFRPNNCKSRGLRYFFLGMRRGLADFSSVCLFMLPFFC